MLHFCWFFARWLGSLWWRCCNNAVHHGALPRDWLRQLTVIVASCRHLGGVMGAPTPLIVARIPWSLPNLFIDMTIICFVFMFFDMTFPVNIQFLWPTPVFLPLCCWLFFYFLLSFFNMFSMQLLEPLLFLFFTFFVAWISSSLCLCNATPLPLPEYNAGPRHLWRYH